MTTLTLFRSQRGVWKVNSDTPSLVRLRINCGPVGVSDHLNPQQAMKAVQEFNPGCRVVVREDLR